MKTKLTLVFAILLFAAEFLSGQSTPDDQKSGTQWSIFWNGSYDISRPNFNGSKFAILGLGISAEKIYKSGVGIQSKLSYRHWNDLDRTMVPLYVGPSYTMVSDKKSKLLLITGLGPAGIIGNDYASVFFAYEVGLERQMNIGRAGQFIAGLAFSQGMAFHPDHFEFLDFTVGWQF